MSADSSVRYGVVGHPVAHSRSPLIHRRFAEQIGQQIDFELIDAAPGHFVETVDSFRHRGGRGLNVTLPYKVDACIYADRLTERARLAAAVNTLAWSADGAVLGDNTDGAGLVADLRMNLGVALEGQRILLMGAGGAARGALAPLAAAGPSEIVIANRTVSRAVTLAEQFHGAAPIVGLGYAAIVGAFDVIINATSASLDRTVPPLPDAVIGADTFCYDMMYQAGPTAFLAWATAHGACAIADGTGMLVEQAAESFQLWRGVRPDTAPVLAEIRTLLA
ncbi:MAG: shikimate dehydrogenase [Gammaproteobacteria bacterium]